MAWDLLIQRDLLSTATVVDVAHPEPGPGQVRLRVDRVGMTSNNVTYAVFGEAMQYWEFFPANDLDGVPQGRVPLWGFADVDASNVDGVAVGTRVYGYLPSSSHLLIEPAKVNERGFIDASSHRQHLPAAYNSFSVTTSDPAYSPDQEDLQVLYRPLFMTSFLLADFLMDNGYFEADEVVISSASSKTSYGTAFLLEGIVRVGLTSSGNREFCEGLGCYDRVVTYDEVESLDPVPAVYVDVAGDATVRRRVHERLEPLHSAVVGASHYDADADPGGDGRLPGAAPAFFFAPDQMRQRSSDWGPGGVEERHAQAWTRFSPAVADWVDVTVGEGVQGLRQAWLEVLSGVTPPRTGHVVQL